MKISDCIHQPNVFARPRADKCEGGDADNISELRVCLTCGYVGCCEDDPGQHARKHAQEYGHQVIASYPADENSFIWGYKDNQYLERDLPKTEI